MTSKATQKVLADRILARRRLIHFTKLTHPRYSAGWVHEDICRRLERFSSDVAEGKSPRLMLLMPPRHGKLLADSTEVLTRNDGWKYHGNLVVGDEVLGLNGWTKVKAVSTRRLKASIEVITSAGTKILAHPNHEWSVLEYRSVGGESGSRKYVPTVVETQDLLDYKEKKGHMMASIKTEKNNQHMRRFYFPAVESMPVETHPLMRLRRKTLNGGRLAIQDVRVVSEEEQELGNCIQVEAMDGVYLVTRDFVPTHNSELASIRFPAWHLGQYPHHELINVGYNLDLPMGFSRKVREVFRDPQYRAVFPQAALDPDSQSVEKWNTTAGGGFTAAGRGGGITGKGAHILIIDDPIKDQEEADSALVRDKLWDWYQSTAYTRLAPGAGVLVIQTWWNDDDLAGRLQQAMAKIGTEGAAEGIDNFEIIKYPALSQQYEYRDDSDPSRPGPIVRLDEEIDPENPPEGLPLGLTLLRPKDFCLHEDRYPTAALKRIRANLQPRIWSALYQQNPVPDEGMYFKKEYFRYQRQAPNPDGLNIFTAWDFAIGEKQQNDWTVGATVLQDEVDQLHVLEIFRMKGDSFQIVEAMLDVAARWGTASRNGYLIGAEDGQIWRALEPLFKKRMAERRQYMSYEVLRPLTDKIARARPLQGRMQQGRVIFPEDAPWKAQAEQELLRFPAGTHDDVVDALAWAAHLCMGKEPPQLAPNKPLLGWRDKLFSGVGQGGHMSA